MIDFEISSLVPHFLMDDKNGKALAKGIEAALKYAIGRMEQGRACVQDVDAMPEWRLDDMAWEYACIYNYSADVDTKREWIRNAPSHSRVLGTPMAVYLQLIGYFNDVKVQEWFSYDGEPYHFRVAFRANKSVTSVTDWVFSCIEDTQNSRSILDEVVAVSDSVMAAIVSKPERVDTHEIFPYCGDLCAGVWPVT